MQEKACTCSQKRESLRNSLKLAASEAKKELEQYTRQVDYDTLFDSFDREAFGGSSVLLKPPYLPGKMYELSEQSSMLSACVRAYVDNIDGYGYDISSAVADDLFHLLHVCLKKRDCIFFRSAEMLKNLYLPS